MLKIVARRPGGPKQLRPVQARSPQCLSNEVAIAVEAAGVNYADCVARMGLYRSAWEMVGWPLTPGFEVSGHVIEVGADVTGLELGDRVIGLPCFGGYAEVVVVPGSHVFAMPQSLSMAEAAAVSVSYLTALHGISLAAPPPGSDVLVHSAAGSAGLALTQVAASNGFRVIGVVGGEEKCATALAAGASAVLVRSREWPVKARALARSGFAAVFDAGGNTLQRSASLVAPMGRLVAYGSHGIISRRGGLLGLPLTALRYWRMPRFGVLELANANRSIMAFNLSYLFGERTLIASLMADLTQGLETGRFRPPPIATYDLHRAAEAHCDLQSGNTVGKLVLVTRAGASSSLIKPQ